MVSQEMTFLILFNAFTFLWPSTKALTNLHYWSFSAEAGGGEAWGGIEAWGKGDGTSGDVKSSDGEEEPWYLFFNFLNAGAIFIKWASVRALANISGMSTGSTLSIFDFSHRPLEASFSEISPLNFYLLLQYWKESQARSCHFLDANSIKLALYDVVVFPSAILSV